jgi:hypothetical protein
MCAFEQTRHRQPASLQVRMSDAIHSSSSQHKQAASAHELAARQHRAAAELHDKGMEHAAQISSATAKACCMKAQKQSMLACDQSAGTPPGA